MNVNTIRSIIAGGALMVFMAAVACIPAFATTLPDVNTADTMQEPAPESLVCLDCHRMPNIDTNEGVIASQTFCYDCHATSDIKKRNTPTDISLTVTPDTFNTNQPFHRFIACIGCHTDVARSPHKTQTGATCRQCHPFHSEGPANAPHLRVSCQACHFQSEFIRLDPEDLSVKLAHTDDEGVPISLSGHILSNTADEKTCEKCHFKNNPASALPALFFWQACSA